MTEDQHLECEIEELRLEIKDNAERIDKLCNLLKQNNTKLRKIKEMYNHTPPKYNVEYLDDKMVIVNGVSYTKKEPTPIVIREDKNTIVVDEVKYQRIVEEPKPITLQRIMEECMFSLNREIQLNLVEHILDRVEVEFFPKLQQEAGYTEVYYKNKGWNNCLKELKGRLRE